MAAPDIDDTTRSGVSVTTATPTIGALARALRQSWNSDTCAPEGAATWNADNPAREQCITTVLVVHDVMGGELVRGEVHVAGERVDYHWWNRLPDGSDLDLTREQFADHEHVIGGATVARPNDGGRVAQQYEVLRARVDAYMGKVERGVSQ